MNLLQKTSRGVSATTSIFRFFNNLSVAKTKNMKRDVVPASTYSACCQRNGKSSSSGKSGLIMDVPETTPPGMNDQSALLVP